ncbi:MAG: GntR family transcriptional regulator [Armatimonadetes bacterium]|nr:GntR family transcriptional regulator [Armatimonadota bacterium]MDW8153173.1 GntR family transcriptional regulator [Armatimonadota bacterium]
MSRRLGTEAQQAQPVLYRYQQIKEHLLQQIQSGKLRTGDRIPPEEELAERFGVSRMTARQAVMELVREGWLYRRQGVGTFVTQPPFERQLSRLTTLSEELEARGEGDRLRSRVLSWGTLPAARPVAELFDLPTGTPLLRVSRVRYLDETPLALQVIYMPAPLVRGLRPQDLERGSVYRVLEDRLRLRIHRAEQRVEAVPATRFHARVLEVPEGSPLLLARRRAYLVTGQLFEVTRTYYRADRYYFQVTLFR